MDFSGIDVRFRHTIQVNCEGLAAVVQDASTRHNSPPELTARLLAHIETLVAGMADAYPEPPPSPMPTPTSIKG